MKFETPLAFLILLIIPVLIFRYVRSRRTGAIRFSSTGNAARTGRSLRQQLAVLPLLLRIAAFCCLTVALARPWQGLERVRDISKGIAIEMVVDRSSSMGAEMEYQGEHLNRLDVVKKVFGEFVMGNGHDLEGRPNDLVGMVAFARYPDTVCPLTLAHGALPPFLGSVRLAQNQQEDGTAIGDAIALAAARLKTAEETLARQTAERGKTYEIKSKVIILLTDGENNCGRRPPKQAAELAAKWGIKIHTIGVGGNESVTTMQTPFGAFMVPVASRVDEGTLKAIADVTGGVYRRAGDAKSLHSIYRDINQMERSEMESARFVDRRELFQPFAMAALIFVLIEVGLICTVFRRIP